MINDKLPFRAALLEGSGATSSASAEASLLTHGDVMQATGSNFFHMVDYADVDGEALRAAEGWTLTLGLLLIKRE